MLQASLIQIFGHIFIISLALPAKCRCSNKRNFLQEKRKTQRSGASVGTGSPVLVIYSSVHLVSDLVSDVSPSSLLWPGHVFLPGHQLFFPVLQPLSLQIQQGSSLFQSVSQKFNFFFILILLFSILFRGTFQWLQIVSDILEFWVFRVTTF